MNPIAYTAVVTQIECTNYTLIVCIYGGGGEKTVYTGCNILFKTVSLLFYLNM